MNEDCPQNEQSPSAQYGRRCQPPRDLAQLVHDHARGTSPRDSSSALQFPQSTREHDLRMIGQYANFSGVSLSGRVAGRGEGVFNSPARFSALSSLFISRQQIRDDVCHPNKKARNPREQDDHRRERHQNHSLAMSSAPGRNRGVMIMDMISFANSSIELKGTPAAKGAICYLRHSSYDRIGPRD